LIFQTVIASIFFADVPVVEPVVDVPVINTPAVDSFHHLLQDKILLD
jgi:hypothetical protein